MMQAWLKTMNTSPQFCHRNTNFHLLHPKGQERWVEGGGWVVGAPKGQERWVGGVQTVLLTPCIKHSQVASFNNILDGMELYFTTYHHQTSRKVSYARMYYVNLNIL